MKALTGFLFTCLFMATAQADGPIFHVFGDARLIASWNYDSGAADASGYLSNGDQLLLRSQQMSIGISAVHKNIGKQLAYIDQESAASAEIAVYEYDFDKDGDPEIMIVDSPEYSIVNIRIFRYSNGLAELVGHFSGQFAIHLEGNSISLPYGSQGLSSDYIYRGGAFFELVYHSPEE